MSPYRIFAVDVDGTLCVPGSKIPDRVVESLRECSKADILVVLATGKRFSSIQHLCGILGIQGPVITCNGAIVLKAGTQEVVSAEYIDSSSYRSIITTLVSEGRDDIAVFTDMGIVCTAANLASSILDSIGEPTTHLVDSLLGLESEKVAKVLLAFKNRDALRAAHDRYVRECGAELAIMATSETFLEFMARGVSKGNALAELATTSGVPGSQIACVGDSDNDLSMFEVAGLSMAVANASEKVLQTADLTVPSASASGVAAAVEYVMRDKHK